VLANDPALVIFLVCAVLFVLAVISEVRWQLQRRRLKRVGGGRPQLRVVAGGLRGWR
jgi:hypothetical protein